MRNSAPKTAKHPKLSALLGKLRSVATPATALQSPTKLDLDLAQLQTTKLLAHCQLIWDIAFLSLALDLILLYINVDLDIITVSRSSLEKGLFLALVLSALSLPQGRLIAWYLRLKQLRHTHTHELKRAALILMALFLGLGLIEGFTRRGLAGVFTTLVSYAVIIASLYHSIRAYRERSKVATTVTVSEISQIQTELFALTVVPLVLSRLVSLVGIVVYKSDPSLSSYVFIFPLLSAVLLVAGYPQRSFFYGYCARCKRQCSLVALEHGSCPECGKATLGSPSSISRPVAETKVTKIRK